LEDVGDLFENHYLLVEEVMDHDNFEGVGMGLDEFSAKTMKKYIKITLQKIYKIALTKKLH